MTKTKKLLNAADAVLDLLVRSTCTNSASGADELESARNALSDALHEARAERADAELARVIKAHDELTQRIAVTNAQRIAARVRLMNMIQNYDAVLENMWRKWAAQRAEILRQQDRRRANGGC